MPTPKLEKISEDEILLVIPAVAAQDDCLHVILQATNSGSPSLTRYHRFIVHIISKTNEEETDDSNSLEN